MLIKTTDKYEAMHAFMNTWLKDKTYYCNNCGLPYNEKMKEPCCEKPEIGTNWDITKRIIEENKEIRKEQQNEFASNKKKDFRMKTRIPPKLYTDLKRYFENEYHEKLFKNKAEVNKFCKKFPVFTIPARI